MRIVDLGLPVTAAKSDWSAAQSWMGFTPGSNHPDSIRRTEMTVIAQAQGGFVLEYITDSYGKPNVGFDKSERYLSHKAAHEKLAGRLIALHRLETTARPIRDFISKQEFEELQDMWSEPGKRNRWIASFPIAESYEIVGHPEARKVLGEERYRWLFQRSSSTLRKMDDIDRELIANLEIRLIPATNYMLSIEQDVQAAERSPSTPYSQAIGREIDKDLRNTAFEGMSEEVVAKIKKRARWLAHKFARARADEGTLRCDDCGFDPVKLEGLGTITPRSLLDVHHCDPLAEGGIRKTHINDFALLCPTCHRLEHERLRRGMPGKFAKGFSKESVSRDLIRTTVS
jgi:5-methylcytosine-specific restriction protein A